MSNEVYSATGCARCKILKNFLSNQGIPFEEYDMKADGKQQFQTFYRNNRKHIYRDDHGVAFPIYTDGEAIKQGITATLGYALSGGRLDGFFTVGSLTKQWVDGIHISGGDPQYSKEFLEVLRHLKKNNLKLQVDTDGRNSELLKQVLDEKLADALIMNVLGPAEMYGQILGQDVSPDDIKHSIALAAKVPEPTFQTPVMPFIRDGQADYVSPEEVGGAAKLVAELTGSKKNAYVIKPVDPKTMANEMLKKLEPLTKPQMFKYRTAARPHQVMAEIAMGT
jgi:pyruvate formate lyase activating enzyme